MRAILIPFVFAISLLGCKKEDDNISKGGATGGKCYYYEVRGQIDYPFYYYTGFVKETNEASTNGKIVWQIIGLNGVGYEIKCF